MSFIFTERQPAGDSNFNWFRARSSLDGRIIYVGKYDTGGATGRLYRSMDYGINWTQLNPTGSDVGYNATHIACSYDGKTVLVASNYGEATPVGKVYISSDYGDTFTELQPGGAVQQEWTVALSGDGQVALIGSAGVDGRLWKSVSPFSSFTDMQPNGDENKKWRSMSMDYDGSVMCATRLVTGGDAKNFFVSVNSGTNWTDRSIATSNGSGMETAMSRDGSVIAFPMQGSASSDFLYLSTDSGTSFSSINPLGATTQYWRGVAVSQDGKKITVGSNSGRIYSSVNQGSSWAEIRPMGDADKAYRGLGFSAGGDRVMITSLTRFYSGHDYQLIGSGQM